MHLIFGFWLPSLYCFSNIFCLDKCWSFLIVINFTRLVSQGMVEELKTLHQECRSNICIEHATGIMEEQKAPENLSKKISNMSLTEANKKVSISSKMYPLYAIYVKLFESIYKCISVPRYVYKSIVSLCIRCHTFVWFFWCKVGSGQHF